MPLVRRNLTCFYCNIRSSQRYTKGLSQWYCTSCDSTNFLDANGDITDPPVASTPSTPMRYARPASPPLAKNEDEEIFCRTCLKNQMILTEALASYLPAPTDPRYEEFERSLPAHKKSLEERYPQVCASCAPKVRERIRQAGYNAKTDHLRRMVERTKSQQSFRRHWTWKEYLVSIAGYAWMVSVAGQLFWNATEMAKGGLGYAVDLEHGKTLRSCMAERPQHQTECLAYLPANEVARISLLLGLLSFWWNNRLFEKLHTPRARLVGLGDHIVRQLILLGVRAAAWLWLQGKEPTDDIVFASHAVLIASTVFGTLLSTRTVTLTRHTPLFLQTVDPLQNISDAPPATSHGLFATAAHLSLSDTPFKPAAAQYSSGFPIDALADPIVPPSPVSVATTRFTRDFETTSEDSTGSAGSYDPDPENLMDWTPTGPQSNTPQNRYNFRKPTSQTKPAAGLFASLGQNPPPTRLQDQINGIEPSPFQLPVPPAPSNPARKLRNPPVTTGFRRVSNGLQDKFMDQVMGREPSPESLAMFGKRRRSVKELEPARLKLNEKEKVTGLEGLFDQVFSLGDAAAEAGPPATGRSRAQSSSAQTQQPLPQVASHAQTRLLIGLICAVFILVAMALLPVWKESRVFPERHAQEATNINVDTF